MTTGQADNSDGKKDLQNELVKNVHDAIIGVQHLSEGEILPDQNDKQEAKNKPEEGDKKNPQKDNTNSPGTK